MAGTALAFDTHKFVKNLTNKGFTEEQAEVLAEEQVNLLNANLVTNERLATTDERIEEVRADLIKRIEEVRADLIKHMDMGFSTMNERFAKVNERIEQVNADLSKRIEEVRADLIKWMAGMLIAVVIAMSGMIVSLIKFL